MEIKLHFPNDKIPGSMLPTDDDKILSTLVRQLIDSSLSFVQLRPSTLKPIKFYQQESETVVATNCLQTEQMEVIHAVSM